MNWNPTPRRPLTSRDRVEMAPARSRPEVKQWIGRCPDCDKPVAEDDDYVWTPEKRPRHTKCHRCPHPLPRLMQVDPNGDGYLMFCTQCETNVRLSAPRLREWADQWRNR